MEIWLQIAKIRATGGVAVRCLRMWFASACSSNKVCLMPPSAQTYHSLPPSLPSVPPPFENPSARGQLGHSRPFLQTVMRQDTEQFCQNTSPPPSSLAFARSIIRSLTPPSSTILELPTLVRNASECNLGGTKRLPFLCPIRNIKYYYSSIEDDQRRITLASMRS